MAIQPSGVSLHLHPISHLYSKEPNTGYFEDEGTRSNVAQKVAYSAILLRQEEEREAVSHRASERVIRLADDVALVASLAAMLAGGAGGWVAGGPSDPLTAATVSGLSGTICFFGVKYSLSLLGHLAAFAVSPLTRIYYKRFIQENSDELFVKELLSFLTSDLSVGCICPLTHNVIQVPAFLPHDDQSDKVQLFELEALVTHVRKHGTHPISKKAIGEESIYSCFFAYRLVERRLDLLSTKLEIDIQSKDKLLKFLDKLKKDLDKAFEFEEDRLESLKNKGLDRPEVSMKSKIWDLIRSDKSYNEVGKLIEGEHPIIWYKKRVRLLESDNRDSGPLVYCLLKYLHMKDSRTEIRVRRLLDALFLKDPDRPDNQQEFRDIEDSKRPHFTDLISFIFEKTSVVYLILDCPIEPKNMVDLERKILAVSKKLSNDETAIPAEHFSRVEKSFLFVNFLEAQAPKVSYASIQKRSFYPKHASPFARAIFKY